MPARPTASASVGSRSTVAKRSWRTGQPSRHWGQASPDTLSVTQLRLRAVLQGRRNPCQRLIETGLWDEPSEAAARAIFATYLQTWLNPGQAP